MCMLTLHEHRSDLSSAVDEAPGLYVSCRMPSLEVGTVGGGTQLPSQASVLSVSYYDSSYNSGGEFPITELDW